MAACRSCIAQGLDSAAGVLLSFCAARRVAEGTLVEAAETPYPYPCPVSYFSPNLYKILRVYPAARYIADSMCIAITHKLS